MNIKLCVSINSGMALIIYALGFFGMLWMAQNHPAIERMFPVALAGWTGAVSFFWIKRNSNNKINLETEKLKVGVSK